MLSKLSEFELQKLVREGDASQHVSELLRMTRMGEPTTVRRFGLAYAISRHSLSLPGQTQDIRVQVVGTSTTEHLSAMLGGELLRAGLPATISGAEYGTYRQELLEQKTDDPDYLVVHLDLVERLENLRPGWDSETIQETLEEFLSELDRGIRAYRRQHRAKIILNTPALPREYYTRVLSYVERRTISLAWRDFISRLLLLETTHVDIWVLDLDQTAFQHGELLDPSISRYTGVHYSDPVSAAYTREVARLIAAAEGRSLKVLVVDLDDTLWQGTLSEGGVDGLADADSPTADAAKALQKCIEHLAKQGIVIVICSKNDRAEVEQAFQTYAGFVMDAQTITVLDAGWSPKPPRIAEISRRLNLGIDSFAFIDDNVSEVSSAAYELNGLLPIHVEASDPSSSVRRLLDSSWFARLESTSDDTARGDRYRTEYARAEAAESVDTLEEYLEQLDTEIHIDPITDNTKARISQLTLRTNQWNLTAKRFSLDDVNSYLSDPHNRIFSVRCKDRFGDHGIIAAIFIRLNDAAHSVDVDNYVMSCRVMGRGVEHRIVSYLVELAQSSGYRFVRGLFLPTAKNSKARAFYEDNGFVVVESSAVNVTEENSTSARATAYEISAADHVPHNLTKFVKARLDKSS